MDAVWGVVVAAGRGVRFGAPKQFWELDGVRLVDRSVHACRAACDAVVVALPPDTDWLGATVDAVVTGGATRAASVRAALAMIPAEVAIVVVHDAARPLAPPALFHAVVDAVRAGADGAVPGVPVADTIKRVDGTVVVETVDRVSLVAVQTPQAFRAEVLRRAHADEPDATDDAALLEAIDAKVVVVPGDAANLKITRPGDLAVASALLQQGGER